MNPLDIPELLYGVLDNVGVTSLKPARLVSRKWANECTKHLERKSICGLNNEDQVQEYWEGYQFDKSRFRMDHSNFRFGCNIILDGHANDLLKNVGHCITSLYLDKTKFSPSALRDILYNHVPNLETLIFDCDPDLGKAPNSMFGDDEIIPPLINLKTLQIKPHGPSLASKLLPQLIIAARKARVIRSLRENNEWEEPTFQESSYYSMFQLILREGNRVHSDHFPASQPDIILAHLLFRKVNLPWENLRILDMRIMVNAEFIQVLLTKRLQLELFDVGLADGTEMESLNPLLAQMGGTLTTLRLFHSSFFQYRRANVFQSSTSLTSLKELTLTCFNGNLRFLDDLPQLKRLTMYRMDYAWLFSPEQFYLLAVHHLKSLEVRMAEDFCRFQQCIKPYDIGEVSIVNNLYKFFPHLKILELPMLSNVTLSLVCQFWPNLLKFTALYGSYDDRGVTGLSHVGIGVSTGELETTKDCAVPLMQAPYIGNLQELKKLVLQSEYLTINSILGGILHCGELKSLSYLQQEMNDKSLNAFLSHPNLKTITINKSVLNEGSLIHVSQDCLSNAEHTLKNRGGELILTTILEEPSHCYFQYIPIPTGIIDGT